MEAKLGIRMNPAAAPVAVVSAMVILAACTGGQANLPDQSPSIPPTVSPTQPAPDARSIELKSLIPAGNVVTTVRYADLDGLLPQEINVASKKTAEDPLQGLTFLQVFQWDSATEEWVDLFHGRKLEGDGIQFDPVLKPPGTLANNPQIAFLEPVDLQGDGSPQLVSEEVTKFGASGIFATLSIFSVSEGRIQLDLVKLAATEESSFGSGAKVRIGDDDSSVVMSYSIWGPSDPHCCPSAAETDTIDYSDRHGDIRVVRSKIKGPP